MKKWVYMFSEGNAGMKNDLGGKGANLAEMTRLGFPIPQGFTVTTRACNEYYASGEKITDEVEKQIYKAMEKVESIAGKKFGDVNDPLLVSVRSGARVSMPGMMDTILNLGLNDDSVETFAKLTENRRFAYDSYRRFIQMFADVVREVDKELFEDVLTKAKEEKGVEFDTGLDADDLKKVIEEYKKVYKNELGEDFPQDPKVQLMESIKAVFRSWNNNRAIQYRKMNDIPGDWGTAVNVQSMVFGNMGDTSGTGVAFTRDPATGENGIFGEYLINAQGEDVVAGIRTPQHISKLAEDMPIVYNEFLKIAQALEDHYKDMQDMEFTIQEGKLYFLQTRNGKRTAQAALKIACDMVDEGLITPKEAVMRIEPKSLDQLLHKTFVPAALKKGVSLGKGLAASPGAASGKVVFTADEAKEWADRGEKVILVRHETSPEDIEGMYAAEGILTATGGMTSHAAVVARGMGTTCVAGCGDIKKLNYDTKEFEIGGKTIKEGDFISLDGSTGFVYEGDIEKQDPDLSGDFARMMAWADDFRTMKVRTNADNPRDTAKAVELGAQGIGLCRTEHMFFGGERIHNMRKMILSDSVEEREAALNQLLPYQKEDFKEMYQVLKGKPMTVRLLDPPLHEFLPTGDDEIEALAKDMGISADAVRAKCSELSEFNPMMGHRGCRLAITYPEIARMQTRAIMEAAIEVIYEKGFRIVPEIMIPLVGELKELKYVKDVVVNEAERIKAEKGSYVEYKVGTMIEIPRAALLADKIAQEAEFFSFGTNDLTQMTFGFSRDDAGKFLKYYYDTKIYENDPFARLDESGVGQLVEMACDKGRRSRRDIKLGICGEHGGDPASIDFCQQVGLDYVSCSPFRVPIARLAAAQAAIKKSSTANE